MYCPLISVNDLVPASPPPLTYLLLCLLRSRFWTCLWSWLDCVFDHGFDSATISSSPRLKPAKLNFAFESPWYPNVIPLGCIILGYLLHSIWDPQADSQLVCRPSPSFVCTALGYLGGLLVGWIVSWCAARASQFWNIPMVTPKIFTDSFDRYGARPDRI